MEETPNAIIGDPVSVMDSMHKRERKEEGQYFIVDDEDWDEEEDDSNEPLSWSLNEPSSFCDWTIEVTHVQSSSNSWSVMNSSIHKQKREHRTSITSSDSTRTDLYHVYVPKCS